jgi:ATP-binding cassette subfamily B multidrug efflux pump
MQHGSVVQRGQHGQLASEPGWYRDMYRYQQLEAALDEAPDSTEEVLADE